MADALVASLAKVHPALARYSHEGPLPLMRITLKSHKNPMGFRFITNASNSLLSGINALTYDICSTLSTLVYEYLDTVGTNLQTYTGIGACSNVVFTNAQHMSLNLPARITTAYAADITKCFEAIPIGMDDPEGIPLVLDWMVATAFGQYAATHHCHNPVLSISAEPGAGRSATVRVAMASNSRIYLSKTQALGILNLAVQSAFVTAGGLIYRQTKGIPMGADYSPLTLVQHVPHVLGAQSFEQADQIDY